MTTNRDWDRAYAESDGASFHMPAMTEPVRCEICGDLTTFEHDHRLDNSGIDDGPALYPPRKKPFPKTLEEAARIREAAWATRRKKYGDSGHR